MGFSHSARLEQGVRHAHTSSIGHKWSLAAMVRPVSFQSSCSESALPHPPRVSISIYMFWHKNRGRLRLFSLEARKLVLARCLSLAKLSGHDGRPLGVYKLWYSSPKTTITINSTVQHFQIHFPSIFLLILAPAACLIHSHYNPSSINF